MNQPSRRASPVQPSEENDASARAADRARLLERVAVGLAHEGKNPLHNMVLHLQLISEKLAAPERAGGSPIEKHLAALKDGIGRVDHLLKAFGEFASPDHLPADIVAAAQRAVQLFAYDVRRASVQLALKMPAALQVRSAAKAMGDLVAHALVAAIESARDGGHIDLLAEPRGAVAVLDVRAEGGLGNREQALAYLDAARRLAVEAACELSIETPAAGGARLSLSFLHTR